MVYEKYFLKEEISIQNIITFSYKELTRQFNTTGENHNFWEFVYIDKGAVEIFTDLNRYELSQGDIVFYKPNEFHAGKARENTAPNLIVVSFECDSQSMDFFIGKAFRLAKEEREILSRIVMEGTVAFDPPVDSPYMRFPKRKDEAPFGSEQIIKNYLEILLVMLIRRRMEGRSQSDLDTIAGENKSKELTESIISYMKENLSQNLTPEQLCSAFAISRTSLMTMFKENMGIGVKEYFNKLKIDQAKLFIREEQYNFTEIAELLGYSSVHYFSKHFKSCTDMTPTEYSRSVKARSGVREK